MKSKISLIFLNFIFSLAFIIFSLFTYFQIENALNNPFSLSDNYVELTVFSNMLEDNRKSNKKLINEIYEIIGNEDVVMIYDDIDSLGLGLFDPNGFYGSNLLTKGDMFSAKDMESIIVREDSYTYDYNVVRMEKSYVKDNANDKRFNITGVYDSDHPLYREHQDYVYNYFSRDNLVGYYYFDSVSQDLGYLKDIQRLLNNNGYDTNITRTSSSNKITNVITYLFGNLIYIEAFIILIFICINLFLFYYVIFANKKKIIRIHSIFGATKPQAFQRYIKEVLISIFLSSTIATIFYNIYFSNSEYCVPLKIFSLIILLNILILSLISTLVFFIGKFYDSPGW